MRISGIEIPDNKHILIALTYIYGIGKTASKDILRQADVAFDKKAKDLNEDEAQRLRKAMEGKYKIEGDLRREVLNNIKRLKEIRCYRGVRHIKKLPVRGQKTKKNARTVRGNVRKTVLSGRKNAPAPK